MSVIFVIASNMDYEDAERLREANRPGTAQSTAATATVAVTDHHPA